jgi:ATP-dependent RNA helicase SUPV3L1/SUV3
VTLLADEQLTGQARDRVQARLDLWLFAHITTLLKPLFDLRNATDVDGIARGVAYRLVEALGTLERQEVAEDVKSLDQGARAILRKHGVRFGAYHIYLPALLKPAPASLVAQLWALKAGATDMPGLAELPQLSASGRTSIKVDPAIDRTLYRLVGFRVAGERAVRLDILERLADIIRPLIAWKPAGDATPPDGAIPQGGGFTVTVAMTSLLGCSGEDFSSILKALGYRMEKRTVRVPVAPAPVAAEAVVDVAPADAAEAAAEVAEPGVPSEAGDAVVETVEVAEPGVPSEAGDAVVETVEAAEPAVPAEAGEAATEGGAEDAAESVEPAAEAEAEDAGEAVATPAEAAPAPVEATATEEREIEVWRPGRFDRGRRPDHRAGQPRGGGDRPQRAGDGERRGPQGEGERRRNDRPGFDARAKDRGHGGDRPRPQGREDRRDDRRHAPGHDKGTGRDGDRGPRREKPVDPNSPFAALLALKADLEQKQKK